MAFLELLALPLLVGFIPVVAVVLYVEVWLIGPRKRNSKLATISEFTPQARAS